MWLIVGWEQRTVAPGPRRTPEENPTLGNSKAGSSPRERPSDSGASEPFEDDGRGHALTRKHLGGVFHL